MAVIRGEKNLIQTETKLSTDPKNNGSTVYSFTGDETLVRNKALQMVAAGYAVDIQPDGPFWNLNCTINYNAEDNPGEVEPSSQWELILNGEEEGILESDRPIITGLTTKTKTAIEYKVKHPESKALWVEKERVTNTAYMAVAGEIYALMASGVKSRRIFTQTLKRTITVSTRFNVSWLQDTAGKVLSTGVMIGRYAIPAQVAVLLKPTSTVVLNQNDGNAYNQIQCVYGWLDNGVSYRLSSQDKIQISQEWLYNKWATALYDVIQ